VSSFNHKLIGRVEQTLLELWEDVALQVALQPDYYNSKSSKLELLLNMLPITQLPYRVIY